ncbi:pseudouridine synthase [Corynebacterium sp.]|uniref:pseudouridine synthase n=1 Tax=Corynebacterium sp. TaxID=1720 RepID=UPI002A90D358|nr:pseudouridine synthase [Corynebacterium sp.]MDY5785020.1 pseudouridine synthase [Corynebacterium sp.]
MARKKTRKASPLPPRGGLGASRVRLPGSEPVAAWEFISRVIAEQRYRDPLDDAAALHERFTRGEVVLRDATPLAPDSVIEPGTDVYFYRRPAPEAPVPFEIETVYEDDTILVVRKPPFLATMPRAAHITETATVRLRRSTGNEELTPAHRLDRLTSGLLLLTKRQELRGAYQELFARREVRKLYEAIAPDIGIKAPTVWRHHILKEHGEIASRIVERAEPNAETLLRDVQRLETLDSTDGPIARYLLEPHTGRTHQLRVQMMAAGAPIIGDNIYPVIHPFGEEDFDRPLLLASVGLEFTDPITGVQRCFTTPGISGLDYEWPSQ